MVIEVLVGFTDGTGRCLAPRVGQTALALHGLVVLHGVGEDVVGTVVGTERKPDHHEVVGLDLLELVLRLCERLLRLLEAAPQALVDVPLELG